MSSKDDKYPEPIDETPKSSLEMSTSTSHDEKLLEEAVSENLDWLIVLNIYLVCVIFVQYIPKCNQVYVFRPICSAVV